MATHSSFAVGGFGGIGADNSGNSNNANGGNNAITINGGTANGGDGSFNGTGNGGQGGTAIDAGCDAKGTSQALRVMGTQMVITAVWQ